MLEVVPISSSIPNRGTFQPDLKLVGLTYLQKIGATTGRALHIQPGIWVTHGSTNDPVENYPGDGQIVARMDSIPHGNALLAGGFAKKFHGRLTLGAPATPGVLPAFSIFLSFNTTPLVIATVPPRLVNAAGASEFLTATSALARRGEERQFRLPRDSYLVIAV